MRHEGTARTRSGGAHCFITAHRPVERIEDSRPHVPGLASLLDTAPITGPVIDPAAADGIAAPTTTGHVFHSWSAQDAINPLPVAGGSGTRFFDFAGNSFLDFGSQLVNLNLDSLYTRI